MVSEVKEIDVFSFSKPHPDNLYFAKIAQVPGTEQYNHHFRMLYKEDVNVEVMCFMKLAYEEEDRNVISILLLLNK